MYKNSFSLENRKENAVLASDHFIRFENVIKNFIPIFGSQLWTVALISLNGKMDKNTEWKRKCSLCLHSVC